jgi:glutaredoxin
MAKEFLSKESVDFDYIDVTKDRHALAEMVEISGSRSVPVIAGCDEVIVGFDKTRLMQMINCIKNRTAV